MLVSNLLAFVSNNTFAKEQGGGFSDGNGDQETSPSDWNADTSVDDMASYCADSGCTSSDLTNTSDKRADFFARTPTGMTIPSLQQYSS